MGQRMISNLGQARVEVGLSQEKLAYQVGCSRQTIKKIESGNSVPNIFLALDIAEAVNKDVSDLFKPL